MSQNSLVLPTTGTVSGLQMTQAMNNALDTLNTIASGVSAPGSPEAGQLWHDTANSLLKLRSLDNTTWIPFLQVNETAYAALPYAPLTGTLNRIVNGNMAIDQMNEGASYAISSGFTNIYTLDQWIGILQSSTASGVTVQRVADAPAGFTYSLKLTVGTGAGSVGSTDVLQLFQKIEAGNIDDFAYGTAGAVAASLSFWVKSSVTGTFTVTLGNSSGGAQQLVHNFTIAAAGTWQQVSVPGIAGPQSGTWGSGASAGLNVAFTIAAGASYQTATLDSWVSAFEIASTTQTNSVLTTTGATFQVTGVMLVPGAFCVPYEKRPVQQELALCERYFQKSFPQGTVVAQNAGAFGTPLVLSSVSGTFALGIPFRTPMRASPTVATYNPAAANANWRDFTNSADRTVTVSTASDKGVALLGASGAAIAVNQINLTANARM